MYDIIPGYLHTKTFKVCIKIDRHTKRTGWNTHFHGWMCIYICIHTRVYTYIYIYIHTYVNMDEQMYHSTSMTPLSDGE